MIQDILRIQYAESTIPESWVFTGGEEEKKVPKIGKSTRLNSSHAT